MHFVIFLVLAIIIVWYASNDKAKKHDRISQYYKFHNADTSPVAAFATADTIYYEALDKFMYYFVEELEKVRDGENRADCVFQPEKLDTIKRGAAVRILYDFDRWWAKEHEIDLDVFEFTCGEQLYAMDLADLRFTKEMGISYDIAGYYDGNQTVEHLQETAIFRYGVSVLRPGVHWVRRLQRYAPPGIGANFYLEKFRPSKYRYNDVTGIGVPFEDLTAHYPFVTIENTCSLTNSEDELNYAWFGIYGLKDLCEYAKRETELVFKMDGICEPFGLWKEENGKIHSVLYKGPVAHIQDLVQYGCPKEYADQVCEERERMLKLAVEYFESQKQK